MLLFLWQHDLGVGAVEIGLQIGHHVRVHVAAEHHHAGHAAPLDHTEQGSSPLGQKWARSYERTWILPLLQPIAAVSKGRQGRVPVQPPSGLARESRPASE